MWGLSGVKRATNNGEGENGIVTVFLFVLITKSEVEMGE